MEHRINWKSTTVTFTKNYNFKWKDTSAGIDFFQTYNFNTPLQAVNHVSGHSSISNKLNLFINMMKYCEKKGLDIFKYIPFTISLNYENESFTSNFENFKELYKNITNVLIDHSVDIIQTINPIKGNSTYSNFNSLNCISSNLSNIKRYFQKFNFKGNLDKTGNKSLIYIASSHFNNKNLWLVKAINLNRGRGIKLCSNTDEIFSYILKLHNGINKNISIIKQKERENKDENNYVSSFNEDGKKQSKISIGEYNFLKPISNYFSTGDSKEKQIFDPKNYNKAIMELNKHIYRSSDVIIQKYIEKPLLYKGRKCDFRIWVLLTHKEDLYVFKEGHLKATSVNYNLDSCDEFIHITNYSLQKYNPNFSSQEIGNEISYYEFDVNFFIIRNI